MNIKAMNEKLKSHMGKVKKWFETKNRSWKSKSETVYLKLKKVPELKAATRRLEGIPRPACYNKSMLRIMARMRKKVRNPVQPSNIVFYDYSKRNAYCRFSDGSLHKVLKTGRRTLIPV